MTRKRDPLTQCATTKTKKQIRADRLKIAADLREWMYINKLMPPMFGDALGLHQPTIWKWLNGSVPQKATRLLIRDRFPDCPLAF